MITGYQRVYLYYLVVTAVPLTGHINLQSKIMIPTRGYHSHLWILVIHLMKTIMGA